MGWVYAKWLSKGQRNILTRIRNNPFYRPRKARNIDKLLGLIQDGLVRERGDRLEVWLPTPVPFTYLLHEPQDDVLKIGSTYVGSSHLRDLECDISRPLIVWGALYPQCEDELCKKFDRHHATDQWFRSPSRLLTICKRRNGFFECQRWDGRMYPIFDRHTEVEVRKHKLRRATKLGGKK